MIGGIGHHVTIVVNLLCDYGEVVFISCPSISGTSISSAISADTQAPWYCLIDEEAHGRIDGLRGGLDQMAINRNRLSVRSCRKLSRRSGEYRSPKS